MIDGGTLVIDETEVQLNALYTIVLLLISDWGHYLNNIKHYNFCYNYHMW